MLSRQRQTLRKQEVQPDIIFTVIYPNRFKEAV